MKADFKALRLDGVTRRFASAGVAAQFAAALQSLTLTIQRGEFIALLGPSGCGKSTALNCISGLLGLSEGSIHLDEVRIDTLPPEARGFGMVFQNYALFPHMNVARNVGFGLEMRRRPAAEVTERVQRALALVQLQAHAEKLPGQLSGGQQQRVAIARAIVIEPPLVLMDEPLSNLDAKLRLEMRTEIRRIHRELGRTTIYVTHDQDEALSLADRIVVLKDGVAQQIASPAEVYGSPANLAVARFMGYRNEWTGDAASAATGLSVRCGGHTLSATARAQAAGAVTVVTRPDDFVLGAHGPNVLQGVVKGVEYYGRESLLDVTTDQGLSLLAQLACPARAGDALTLSVAPERVLAYPRPAP
jgi:putative spermidine/putrescine transport system ATP-binding protein